MSSNYTHTIKFNNTMSSWNTKEYKNGIIQDCFNNRLLILEDEIIVTIDNKFYNEVVKYSNAINKFMGIMNFNNRTPYQYKKVLFFVYSSNCPKELDFGFNWKGITYTGVDKPLVFVCRGAKNYNEFKEIYRVFCKECLKYLVKEIKHTLYNEIDKFLKDYNLKLD